MTEKNHGIDCHCCEPKSENVTAIISKINEIVGRNTSETPSVIADLEELATVFKTGGDATAPVGEETDGDEEDLASYAEFFADDTPVNPVDYAAPSDGIDDIVDIAKAFLTIPVETFNVEQLKLTDPDKMVGSFKVADLSDNPTLDITKILDFSKLSLGGLKSLKFSISVPTITVVKSLKIGPISVGIKFIITLKAITWLPVSDFKFPAGFKNPYNPNGNDMPDGIDTKAKALTTLKGVTVSLPVTPSCVLDKPNDGNSMPILGAITLDQAKFIASKSYATSKEVQAAIASAITADDFFTQLSAVGAVLTQDVDIDAHMQQMIAYENAVITATPFDDSDCGTPPLVPAPFDPDELKELEKECCAPENAADLAEKAKVEAQQIEDVKKLDDLEDGNLTDDEEAEALADLNDFLSDLTNSNTTIQDCATQKQNAVNSFYFFLEAAFLNNIALEYHKSRALTFDSLNGTFDTLQLERLQKIKNSITLKEKENQLYKDTYQRLSSSSQFAASKTDANALKIDANALKIDDQIIKKQQLIKIESDITFKTAVSSIRAQYTQNEKSISEISSLIQDQKALLGLPTLTKDEIQNIKATDITDSTSVFAGKTESFRQNFMAKSNPISNNIGYGWPGQQSYLTNPPDGNVFIEPTDPDQKETDYICLYVHPLIYAETKTLFALNSPQTADLEFYIQPLAERKRLDASMIWNKYYNPNRIDILFTYQEQGFTSPKPLYDDNGNPLSPNVTMTISNPSGADVQQEVSESVLNIGIDETIAIDFWPNIEEKTYQKVLILFDQLKATPQYQNLIGQLVAAGKNEAKIAYAANLIFQEISYSSRMFDDYTNTFSFNQGIINNSLLVNVNNNGLAEKFKSIFNVTYESVNKFANALTDKQTQLTAFIEEKKKCMADQENIIADKSERYANKANRGAVAANAPPKDECPPKLGSDPLGLKSPSDCPGITKNCYWKEYTKKMQLVSLMPIPDVQFLTKRLFRYYPVAIQIPVPSPAPVVLPTLASGIPDPMISIPLPIIWKHIITLSTPIGLFVVWIGMCGPIPGPYVLYFDEKVDPCFLITPKGPISVPAKALKVNKKENKTLLEMLAPLDKTFKVPIGISPFNKLLMGTNKFKLSDPDHPKTFIDSIQAKIKTAVDSIEGVDPSWQLSTPEMRKKKKKIQDALKKFPPDIGTIQDALGDIEKLIDAEVDKLKIKSIKFPKNAKRLIKPTIGPTEFMDPINKLLDAAIDPALIGFGLKMLSLRKELKVHIDRALSDPDIVAKFAKIDADIVALENKLRLSGSDILDTEKAKLRVKEVKKAMKAVAQKVADKITPEMLGFIASLTLPIPLPVPCYTNVTIAPVPPYVTVIIAAIKELPSLIDALPDQTILDGLGKFINMKAALPRVNDFIFFATKTIQNLVPDLKFPDPESANLLKQIILTSIQNVFKIKIRLPHPGVPGIIIPSSLIKSLIKKGVKLAFAAIVGVILEQLVEATNNNDFMKVLAVVAIIKAVFGTDLGSLSANDIKSFITGSLDVVDQQLEQIKSMLISIPKIDFKSIKKTLFPTLPPKIELKPPFFEVGTAIMLTTATPLLKALQNVSIPFPVVLLGCTIAPTRLILTKLHPFSAKEPLPSWDKMSLQNVPFVIWLDGLIATAQRQGGIFSDYVVPYYFPDV
jgi:hypothetical protein